MFSEYASYLYECIDDFLINGVTKPREQRARVAVHVGDVVIGGGAPVVVQSMALGGRTLSENCSEVVELAQAGSELVRVALNCDDAAKAMPYMRDALVANGFGSKILVGCGQYEIERLLKQYPECIDAMGKIRINPGNIGFGNKRDVKFDSVIECAIAHDMPVRIGVNWGSIDPMLLAEAFQRNEKANVKLGEIDLFKKASILSVLLSAKRAMDLGLPEDKIVLSCKVSRVQHLVSVYTILAHLTNLPLHLGLTEAGSGMSAIVSTSAAVSILLTNGIGDTIRASLTTGLQGKRTDEVVLCKEILQALDLRYFKPKVVSCPGCNRTNRGAFGYLVEYVNSYIENSMDRWSGLSGVEKMVVAVMGCVVNGPGESKKSDIAISMPGNNEDSSAVVFADGKNIASLHGDKIAEEFCALLEKYVSEKYCVAT